MESLRVFRRRNHRGNPNLPVGRPHLVQRLPLEERRRDVAAHDPPAEERGDAQDQALGEPAGMLSLGLRRSLGRHWAVDVSFAEDIVVESAPDIIFQASLHYRP